MRSAMQAQWAAVDMLLGFIQLGGGVGSNSHHRKSRWRRCKDEGGQALWVCGLVVDAF